MDTLKLLSQVGTFLPWNEIGQFIRTFASILIPILAVGWKVYSDRQKLETQAIITNSNMQLKELITKHKQQLAETIGNLQLGIGRIEEGNEFRDREIGRINDKLEAHLNKI